MSVEQEIKDSSVDKPHVLLLGAGASKAALPKGDKNGNSVPLLRDVAESLNLFKDFPGDLQELAAKDFEAAYSRLSDRDASGLKSIDAKIREYFSGLVLPDEVNLYDLILLCLRKKDAVFTFNWDPFLIQSHTRLVGLGVTQLPQLFFLHGNVAAGFCADDGVSGPIGGKCSRCGKALKESALLFPVEKKNYQDGGLVEREWKAIRKYLKECFMLTIFGYSAPVTDVEAIGLLKEGWGSVEARQFEQTEIITRPGYEDGAIRERWEAFIHTHHYDIHGAFQDSWMAKHPRRTGEAYRNQFLEAKFIDENQVPDGLTELSELVGFFSPLLDVEKGQ